MAQFLSLCGRRDVVNPDATSVDEYLINPPTPVNDRPSSCGTLMTHSQSIKLIDRLGANFTPELKAAEVDLPFNGVSSRDELRRRMLEEYLAAGIEPARVYPQSFFPADVDFWLAYYPDFSERLVQLDGRGRDPQFKASAADMQQLVDRGVHILAPPLPMLLVLDEHGELQPSTYARHAKRAGLDVITWTFESGDPTDASNWLYANLPGYMREPSDMLKVLDALHSKAGIRAIFSDWPATVTYYANCLGLE